MATGGQAQVPTATAWCSAPPPAAAPAPAPAPATTTSGLNGPQHQASTGLDEASTGTPSAPASAAAAAMRPQLMPHLGHGVQDAGMASMAEMVSWQQHQHAGGGALGMPIAHALPHSMLPGMMSGMPVATARAINSPQLPLQAGAPTAAIPFPASQQAAAAQQLAMTAHRVGPQQASAPLKVPTSTGPFVGG